MKIKDCLVLGMISGIIANTAKGLYMESSKKIEGSRKSFTDVAASLFLHSRDIRTPLGQLVGTIADYSMALASGVASTYLLARTGKKHWFLKGAASGSMIWVIFFGFLGTLGKSNLVYPTTSRTALSSYFGHILFGVVNNYTAIKLGDDEIFIESKKTNKKTRKPRPLRGIKRPRITTN